MTDAYEMVVGLEVHVQLKTRSKMFCACAVEFGAAPNTHVCPVCLGLPGSLPVLNAQAVDFALRLAEALGDAFSLEEYVFINQSMRKRDTVKVGDKVKFDADPVKYLGR